ncbi:MAG: hypothetical protein JKX95_02120 [Bacteroidia bacterium]|nr:hypothetical protein [Bacteroidia bacterium]
MKNITLIALLTLIFSCSTDINEKETSQSKNVPEMRGKETNQSNIVTNFLYDVTSLENEESKNPIIKFQEIANTIAEKVILINKENIEYFLTEAIEYKYCVITTGDHTIVKIEDFNNCKQSGSWAACMPYAEGYIKKGKLIFEKDYSNNIIGRPDSQKRTAYLFN